MRPISVLSSAVAAGLCAHLLSESLSHRGSATDIAILVAALCCLFVSKPRTMNARALLFAGVGAALVATGWPLLEPGTHHFAALTLSSLLWLLPVALTFICSISLLAHESIALVRAVLERPSRRPAVSALGGAAHFKDEPAPSDSPPLCMFSRRGPPAVLCIPLST